MILVDNICNAAGLAIAFKTPMDAWRAWIATTDEDAHVKAWHAWRDAEFQRQFAKRPRRKARPFNRT